MPCIDTMCKLFALRSILSVLDDTGHPARSLALYFLGPSRRTLVPRALGNLYPSAESAPPFYRAVVSFHKELRQLLPGIAVRVEPPARVVEEVCSARVTPEVRDRANGFPWGLLVSRRLPSQAEDIEWRRGWEVLPTRQHLYRWGIVPDPRCPNCGQVESNAHVFVNCPVAPSFWRLVHHGFRNLGIANYVSGGRCPRGGFALLLLAVGHLVLWRNRCAAVGQQRRIRAMWPLLSRLRGTLFRHLDSELFWLGEEEFLRRWFCRYVRLANGRVLLTFAPLQLV
ncbi:unnamed protein product [Ixodes hexagonus]